MKSRRFAGLETLLSQLDRDKQAKGSPSERGSPCVTMKMVSDVHNKLEIRFRGKMYLRLALDCERRRKRAERRPLVVMGDIKLVYKS